jgi:hypothetical protein
MYVQSNAIQSFTMRYSPVLCDTVPYYAIQSRTLRYSPVLCDTVPYYAIQSRTRLAPIRIFVQKFPVIRYSYLPFLHCTAKNCCEQTSALYQGLNAYRPTSRFMYMYTCT